MPLTGPWRGASSRRLAKAADHGPVAVVPFLPATWGLRGVRRKLCVRRWTLIDAGPGEQDGQTGKRSGADYRLKVVENTPQLHNVIVCTLCSCYPTSLLGPSPSWYKSVAYRSRVVREPRSVLAEFGLSLPGDVQIAVWDSSAETRYLVLPVRPVAAAGLDEAALASLVTRDGMIGTAAV